MYAHEMLVLTGLAVAGWALYTWGGARLRLPHVSGRMVLLCGVALWLLLSVLNLARWQAFSFGLDTAILYQNFSAPARTGHTIASISGYENAVMLLGLPAADWTGYASHLHTHHPLLLLTLYRLLFALCGATPATLLLPYNLLLCLTPWFLYRYWRERFAGTTLAGWLTLAFMGNYLFLYPSLGDITEFPFALPLHAAFLWLLAVRRHAVAIVLSLLALLVHEQLVVLYGCFALLLLTNGERRAGLLLLTAQTAVYLLLRGSNRLLDIAYAYRQMFDTALLADGSAWLATLGTLVLFTAPFLFLPWRNRSMFGVAGILFLYLLSGRSGRYTVFHTSYAAFLLPLLLYGFTEALARLRWREGMVVCLLPVTVLMSWYKGPLPLACRYLHERSPRNLAPYTASPHDRERAAAVTALRALPDNSTLTVLAGHVLLPALTDVTPRLFPLYGAPEEFAAGADVVLYDACDPTLASLSAEDAEALRGLLAAVAARPGWETRQAGEQLLALVRGSGPVGKAPWPRVDNPHLLIDTMTDMSRQVRQLRHEPRYR